MAQVTRWSGTTSSEARTATKARNTALWWISAAISATGTVGTLYTATEIKCVCCADMVN
jgi:hypothetical protein